MAPSLPTAVLAQVLQHVPQQQRLSVCTLVCTDWAAAAALATVNIDANRRFKGDKLPAFQSWLVHHAKQLVSIKYKHRKSLPYLQLPSAELLQLTSLELENQMLLLGDAGSSDRHPAAA